MNEPGTVPQSISFCADSHTARQIRVLVQMHAFHGGTLGALWEGIKFEARRFSDVERLAFVGDRKWETGMEAFCKPFTRTVIRYFDEANYEEALGWIMEGVSQPA